MSIRQPNILLIMADQLMPFLTGAYGHPVVKTPNLDRLAQNGIRFDAAYTPCPLCAPARAAFMSGQYGSRIGCYDNANVLPDDEPTIAHYLSNAGYDTVLSGKMHFVGADQLHGFRQRLTTDIYPSRFNWVPSRDESGNFMRGGHTRGYVTPDLGVRAWSMGLAHDEETHFRALEYLRAKHNETESQPFFLCASYHHPHDPFHVTQDLWDLYENKAIDIPEYPDNLAETYSIMDQWLNEAHGTSRFDLGNPDSLYQLRRSYYGLVTYIDNKVGELLETLRKLDLDGSTVVIFVSDHGDMLAEKKMIQKRCFYEWSARIPLIISFPDGYQAGRKVEQPVSLIDIVPTVLDLADVAQEARAPMDAQSLSGLIDGSDKRDRITFSEFHTDKVKEPCFMVRQGKYKYIHIHNHPGQLFDLEADPGEWDNLLGRADVAEVESALHNLILDQFDPETIKQDALASVRKREIVREAMERNNTHWDYFPYFDATRQYVR